MIYLVFKKCNDVRNNSHDEPDEYHHHGTGNGTRNKVNMKSFVTTMMTNTSNENIIMTT